jgi:hypothetical protein
MTAAATPRVIALPLVPDPMGDLVWLQEPACVPFPIRRVYFVTAIPAWARRGGHAHRRATELVVAARGAFSVHLRRPQGPRKVFRLERANQGLLIPPGWWLTIDGYVRDSLCLVLASLEYDEVDYIRDEREFLALASAGGGDGEEGPAGRAAHGEPEPA